VSTSHARIWPPRPEPEPEPEPAWQDFALCAETDPEAFFPEKGGSTREAKRVCRGCEVKMACLDYALATDQRFGIWGGFSERERRHLKRGAIADDLPAAPRRTPPADDREPVPELTAAEVDRFHARLAPGACGLAWTGDVSPDGYGRLAVYRDKRRVWVLAHRLAWKLAAGQDPAGLVVTQECGRPWCCTPECLLPGIPGSRTLTRERAA
jgi:WhiB family transcriptional regulator, redox-sensing transcriptional regulator